MRRHAVALLLLPFLASLALQAAPSRTFRSWTKSDLVDAVSVHASRVASSSQPYLLYVDLAAIPPDARARKLQALGYVVNSWSRNDLLALPQEVPGTEGALAWVDISLLREKDDIKGLVQLRAALDKLGEKGSGPAPFPEPYYHAVTEDASYRTEVGYYDSYGAWVHVRWKEYPGAASVALGPHLNRATTVGLASVTGTNFPIFEYHWLLANRLSEPRYHELLGLDDSEDSVDRLAGVDAREADRRGAQLRGAVLFSEVAHRNRVLERTPLANIRHGRGAIHRSFDFKTSIRLQNVLKNLLIVDADAHEIIFTLPCGLLGFYVSDANRKRLDVAVADVATSGRRRFRDPQVRTAFTCMECHLQERGWIEVDDEVREFARHQITLLADAVARKDIERGRRIRQKYFTADYNELLRADQSVTESAVRAATRGLTSAETNREIMSSIALYLDQPVTVERFAIELGASKTTLLKIVEATPGLDHTLVGFRVGRPQRRDQIETSFGQAAAVLYLSGGR